MRVRASPFHFPARITQSPDPTSQATAPSRTRLPAIFTIFALVRRWRARSARRTATTWEQRAVEMSDAELASLARRIPPSPEDVRWRLVLSASGGRRP
jgi:hypothetical protein